MKRCNILAVTSLVFTITMMSGGVAGAVPVITNGLAAYYPFEGNANDSSSVGNDGVESGSPNYVGGVNGSAIHFDGIDDSVVIPANPNLSFGANDFSVGFWFRLASSTDGPVPAMWVDERCCDERGFWLGASLQMSNSPPLGGVYFAVSGSGFGDATKATSSLSPIIDDEWHMVVGTRSGSAVSVYLDGLLVGVGSGPTYDVGDSNPIHLGQRFNGDSFHLGTMDEVFVYDRALSASEVQTLFSSVPEPSTALLLGIGLATMSLRTRATKRS